MNEMSQKITSIFAKNNFKIKSSHRGGSSQQV